jgi:hypothetical protein
MLCPVALVRTDVSEERIASNIRVTRIGEMRLLINDNDVPTSRILVTLMTEAIPSSETSDLTRVTRHHTPEDSILQVQVLCASLAGYC